MLGAAPLPKRRRQPPPGSFHRADLGGQPRRPPLLIRFARRAGPERLADLRPVVLDRPRRPRVLPERRRADLHKRGHVLHRGGRHLLRVSREAALDLVELQHQGKAQPGRSGLVAHHLPVTIEQRPRADQIFRFPLSLHALSKATALDELERS